MIRAPFNFIRLSDQVFSPEWADKISHDVPFIDWFSGVISLDITAASPVFVRNGHTQEDENNNGNDRYNSFSRINEQYFIPGTSIKGAVRNVLSIISNGKIRVDKNLKFAQREWDNKILYPLKGQQNNFLCGWLKWDKEIGYYIENHGNPYRIAHTRLDEYFRSQGLTDENLFESKFSSESGFNLNSECEYRSCFYDPKTATYKYALVDNIELYDLNFEIDDEYANEYKPNRVKVVEEESDNSFKGCIVFTGQPSQWVFPRPKNLDPTAGKFYDFVFRNDVERSQKFAISDEDFHKYESIYEDNCDWKRWKSEMYSKGIPVFFRLENKKIKDWGLAFLYKLPYERTPFETLPSNHRSSKLDLADCIFGSVSKDFSLKGRVSFGHAFCTDEHPQVNSNGVRLVLSSPKASYYPIYIAQKVRNGRVDRYETYNDGQIAGWKRYPIRNEVWGTATGSDLLDTVLYPLDTNSHFISKVRFFNLNTFELGALLSALTFHDNENNAYYQLGQGKPFGYGKVRVKVMLNCLEGKFVQLLKDVDAPKALMAYYENQMKLKEFPLEVSLSKLLPMVSSSVSGHNFEYMTMSNERNSNEFLQEKARKSYLQPFTVSCTVVFHSLYNQYASVVDNLNNQIADLYNKQQKDRKIRVLKEEILKQQEEIKKLEQARIEKEEKQREVDSLKRKGNELKQNQDYQQALINFEEAYSIEKTLELKQLIDECRSNLNKQQRPINECILNEISSIPAYTNNINKWLKLNNRGLSDDEKQQILEHVLKAYNKLGKKKDKKKWKNSLKDLINLLGMDISVLFKD